MRRSLYLKDDDYRLSFLYGNFTTLTRFTELDAERILTERLGPLFVSIHTTDPELRAHMLRNPKGATSLRWLEVLLDGGIEVHGQIVVCPGVNDGAALEDTLAGILDRYPALASVGAVPLGRQPLLQRARDAATHRRGSRVRPRHRRRMAAALPQGLGPPPGLRRRRVLPAGRTRSPLGTVPTTGTPSTRTASAWHGPSPKRSRGPVPSGPGGVRHGFFASVDAAPAEGYRAAPRPPTVPAGADEPAGHDPDRHLRGPRPRPARGVAPTPRRRVAARSSNDFFGGNIGVAGLLTGEDMARALAGRARRVALPAARRLPQRGPLPRRPDAGGPAQVGRGRAHRRAPRCAGRSTVRPSGRCADR